MKNSLALSLALMMTWFLIACGPTAELKRTASKQVSDLKEKGVVLVRLHTQTKKIKYLEKHGQRKLAQRIQKEQNDLNTELRSSFVTYFDFCPVYFFYAEDSRKILNNEHQGIFLNKQLVRDSSIQMTNEHFAIAELNWTTPDTTSTFSESYAEKDSTGWVQRKRYYTSSDISFEALLLRDKNFAQFHEPFPAYVKKYIGGIKRSSSTMVKILNKELKQSLQQYRSK